MRRIDGFVTAEVIWDADDIDLQVSTDPEFPEQDPPKCVLLIFDETAEFTVEDFDRLLERARE